MGTLFLIALPFLSSMTFLAFFDALLRLSADSDSESGLRAASFLKGTNDRIKREGTAGSSTAILPLPVD